MAKRDKLYTVNKWNRPFFEQERRKKLYGGGGSTDNYVWGLNTDQGLTRAGIAQAPVDAGWKRNMPGWASDGEQASNPWREVITTHAAIPTENATPAGNLNQQDTNASNGSNNSKLRMIQDAAIAARDFASGIQSVNKLADLGKPISNPTQISSSPSTGLFGNTGFGARTTVFTETPYTPSTSTVFNNVLNPRTLSQNIISPKTVDYTLQGASGFSNTADNFQKTIGYYLQTNPQSDFAKSVVLNNLANSKITQPSLIEGYTPKAQTSGISDLGKAGVGIGASILGEVGGNLISDGFSTVPGTLINQIGSAAGTVLSMIPGVGWVWGPAVTLGSKLLGGVYNRAFGSEYKDNGATAYTNQLNALNPNGSNEYLANLLASTGVGPRATSRNGWFNHSAERRADRTNTAQDLAFNRFQRGVRDAFGNNNWKQLQYALNDYTTYGAMGGRIKRKKCNCKATGGFLNNAMLDSASATGYNFLSDLTNMQMQNNQNKQDMGSSLGNSFTGLSNGTLFANGGGININPAHKGEFTAKAKRHGMGVQQFANYVLAHKDKFPTSTIRQAVFAKNSNTWKKAFGGKLNYGKDKDIRDSGFFDGQTLYAIGGPLQAMSSNWSPGGNVTEINAGGQHEENPYEGVQVGVDPEGTPNLVEENEVIWNDYVFSNRLKVPKEVCKELRVGQKKDGFTFAEVAKKLLKESKERPNDPISKRGLDANMQKLEDAQEELKQKMEAEEAVEQFNSLPPEQQVAIMQQEGEKAQDAVAQEQMAQQIQNLPPEQQQAIAQQMAMKQAQQQGMPQQGMSPEEQYAMQQQAMQDQAAQEQYAQQRDARNQEILAQAAAMQDQAINSSAMGGKLYQTGGKKYIKGAKSHWETNAQGHKVLAPNTPFENTGFGGGRFGMAGGGAEWGDEPAPLAPKKRDWLAIDYKESFNDAYRKARKEKKKTFLFNGKEYSTDYNPNLTEEQVRQGMNRYQDKGLIIAPWEHAYGGPLCFGGKMFAEGGELDNTQSQTEPDVTQQPADTEMAKYSDEELQDMIDDYQEAESGEVKVTKGKLARLRKKAEKAERELERRHSQESEKQPQETRQEPSQEEVQAAAQEQAQQQMMEGQPQEGMPQEGVSPEQAMMMQQQMDGGQMSPEQMAAAELQQQGEQYAYGGKLYPTGGKLSDYAQYFPSMYYDELASLLYDKLGLNLRVETSYANEKDKQKNAVNTVSKEDFIKAMRANNYDVDAALKSFDFTSSDYVHPQQAALDLVEPSGYTKNLIYNLNGNDNTYRYSDINPDIYRNAILQVYYDRNPEARNSGWTFNSNPYRTYANVNFHDATSAVGNNGNKMVAESFYANDPAWSQLTEQQRQLKGNELAAALEATQAYKDFSQYLRNNRTSQYVKDYFTELANRGSKIAKNALADWDNMTASKFDAVIKNLREDASAPPNSPGNKNNNALGLGHFTPAFAENWTNRYWVKDADGNYSQIIGGIADADKDKYIAINTNPYQVTVDNNNYNDFYYRLKTDAEQADSSKGSDTSNYLTVGWKPKTNWTDYTLGMLPGLTGLGMMFAQGKPDTSGLEAAANAYAANMGVQAPMHLTHGLMKPAIIDPRITHNTLTASRLGTNRLLRNTGSAPSQAASILANDTNYQHQMGSNDLRDWLANREQEQKAATFNEGVARANAQFLNQGDQFNAQMLANAGEKYAQARYNLEKEKLDQENAWRAGILGNIGSAMTGFYNAYREGQNRNERDLLAASEVFGPTNGLLDYYYGINKVDPKTGLIKRGPDAGKYWYNGSAHSQPQMAISAKGGKLNRKNKRKGFTF